MNTNETGMKNQASENAKSGEGIRRRPSKALYHATAKGTGAAVRLSVQPARVDSEGCVWLELASQLTVGDRKGATPTFPTFDWEHKIVVRLGFEDLCEMLRVFRGECESIADGKGLYHTRQGITTRICMRHQIDPFAGYGLDVYRNSRSSGEESHVSFIIASGEALGICCAIEQSLGTICFGVPREADAA